MKKPLLGLCAAPQLGASAGGGGEAPPKGEASGPSIPGHQQTGSWTQTGSEGQALHRLGMAVCPASLSASLENLSNTSTSPEVLTLCI